MVDVSVPSMVFPATFRLEVTPRLVVVELAKVVAPDADRLVVLRLVEVALEITALVDERLVEVLLVITPLVDERLVEVALVKLPLVEKSEVEVALVIIDEVAKIFCENRLRKRSDEDPKEKVASDDGVVLPAICSLSVGDIVPIPTLPVYRMVNSEVVPNPAVVEDTVKSGRVEPSVP